MVQEVNSAMPTGGFMLGQKGSGMPVPSVQERLGIYAGRLQTAAASGHATLNRVLNGAVPDRGANPTGGEGPGMPGIDGLLDGIDASVRQVEALATRLEELQQRIGSL